MISVTYFTLQGLEDKLNAIDKEDTNEQFTSILSLVVLPALGEDDPTAVLITKTELVPEEVKAASAAEAAELEAFYASQAADEGEAKAAPEFFAAPEAAEDDEPV